MFFEKELNFLCEIFKKSRVRAIVVSESNFSSKMADTGLEAVFGESSDDEWSSHRFPSPLEDKTLYKSVDRFGLRYVYLPLPNMSESTLLFIGPYLDSAPSKDFILKIGAKNSVSQKRQRYLEEYYTSVPVLPDSSHLFIMLETFCELIWRSPSFAIIDVNNVTARVASPINETLSSDGFDDVLVNMKAVERRYAFENEIMRSVSLGQLHREPRLLEAFSENKFEKRTDDALRNAKNYCIIMNTLLRKAVESGGVHPMYIDKVSSNFAVRIENMPSISENTALMREMFRSYCRLVRKHSIKQYSLLIQKTVLLIESDLSAELTLSSLAKIQGVSPAYLSDAFSKETGKTLSQYIREKRIDHAINLLTTTNLQIQTVALHCGIVDVQYFSKLFKKQTGKTPREYRAELKKI